MIGRSRVLVLCGLGGHSDESVHFEQAQMTARKGIKEMMGIGMAKASLESGLSWMSMGMILSARVIGHKVMNMI